LGIGPHSSSLSGFKRKLDHISAFRQLIFGRPFVKRFALCYRTVVLSVLSVLCPVCDVGALWPNGCMDQGRPRPWPHCVRRGRTQLPLPQRDRASNFRPISLSVVVKWLHASKCHLVWRYASAQATLCHMGPRSPSQKKGGAPSPIFGPFLLWPNGWMDQDATWHGGRPQPRELCVRSGPSPLPKWGWSPPIFGPSLLRPNGGMDQDATWYGGRPRPRRHSVRWGTSSPRQKRGGGGAPPQLSAHVYCCQTTGWIKMAIGTEVGLGPVHIVLDGDPAPLHQKGTAPPPIFGPLLLWPNG